MGDMNRASSSSPAEEVGRTSRDPQGLRDYHVRLRDLAVEDRTPVTWGVFSRREAPEVWRTYLALLEETAAAGGRMSRRRTAARSTWCCRQDQPTVRPAAGVEGASALPLDQQRLRLRDPEVRRRLVEAAGERHERRAIGAEPRPAAYDGIFVMTRWRDPIARGGGRARPRR